MSSIFTIGPVPPEAFTVWSFDGGTIVEVDNDLDPIQVDAQAA